tara:strand:+ start:664 stop:780 length:117 start_codon:yes stop_codon:yes gene_type:complete
MHSLGSLMHRKLCVAFALPKSMAMGEKEKMERKEEDEC